VLKYCASVKQGAPGFLLEGYWGGRKKSACLYREDHATGVGETGRGRLGSLHKGKEAILLFWKGEGATG